MSYELKNRVMSYEIREPRNRESGIKSRVASMSGTEL